MEKCPCCSGKNYDDCCKPYITGKKDAPTAEALMRSRYSAYAMNEIDYIEATHIREERDNVSVEETKKWAEESIWLNLEIVSTKKGLEADENGVVEFKAKYQQGDVIYTHHEVSKFAKTDGKWYFAEGRSSVTSAGASSDATKVGRNDPCPCGSGKKYKKCCSG
ncbi:MAG: YchJ family protein [Spirochaetales bacterium]|nr:YchJ family protein [Spirochaetales bacterium]